MTGTADTERVPRIAFVTIGQAPRPDIVPEILGMLDEPCTSEEFGALDGLSQAELSRHLARGNDDTLYTRLAKGRHVALRAAFVEERLNLLLERVDRQGHDLIALITTGVFGSPILRTPLIHGQHALEAWATTLVLGNCQIGVIYPLARQARRAPLHGTLIRNARSAAAAAGTHSLDIAARRLATTDLILMLSVGHTEEMARRVSLTAGRPVVTTRRIIVGQMHLHLSSLAGGKQAARLERPVGELIGRLPPPARRLTRREEEVLALVLDGRQNKAIGEALGISHRTVEIHRSHVMAKFGTSSTTDLIRWALRSRGGSGEQRETGMSSHCAWTRQGYPPVP